MNDEKSAKREEYARKILDMSRNQLFVSLRYLDMALSMFELAAIEKSTLITDGKHLLFNPEFVLKSYKAGKEVPVRDYLHIVMHCIYRHMFTNPRIDRKKWDLACDIAVENVINEIGLKTTECFRQTIQKEMLSKLRRQVNQLTAEKLYIFFVEEDISPQESEKLRGAFYADDHEIWYMTDKEKQAKFGIGTPRGNEGEDDGKGSSAQGAAELSEQWKKISERMQVDAETFGKKKGNVPGSMLQNLKEVNREKYDYTAFLRKFAVYGEAMKINDDEFDYNYYTYGLKLYRNMPLIEPLEYKDVKRIREFVIAIDTSGSVSGNLVQKFIQKTYNILESTESFFTKINLHIIQCDADIQEHVKITSKKEFDEYLKGMKIHGLGGTDFRPVFNEVNKLVKQGEFTNLKGLIYFTDGCGTYPAKKPGYETAFVFVDDEGNDYSVPSWAIKLILKKDEI